MTFTLVAVVYAVAIGEPSFGIMGAPLPHAMLWAACSASAAWADLWLPAGPLVVGLALFTMVFAGPLRSCTDVACAAAATAAAHIVLPLPASHGACGLHSTMCRVTVHWHSY